MNNTPTLHSSNTRRGALVARILVGLALAAGLYWGIHYALRSYHFEETDDAYVTGHLHQISPQVGGQVIEVRVTDNQEVKEGDVLVRIDAAGFEIAAQKAHAAVAQARALVSQAESTEQRTSAQLEEAKQKLVLTEAMGRAALSQLDLAETSYNRVSQLYSQKGDSSQADVDKAKASLEYYKAGRDMAASSLVSTRSAIDGAAAAHRASVDDVVAAKAALASAEAAERDAERQRGYTEVCAPAAGRVGNKRIEIGNTVQAGQTVLSIAEPKVWVTANFKETQLARMKAGQEAEITIDAIPGHMIRGHIESFAPATGAQFALLPPDNATGNFNKVVQRVPVKIVFEETDPEVIKRLSLGLSAIVEVRVR